MDAELVAWEERVRGCEDVQLMAELQQLVRRDRKFEVRLLIYLAEVDERRLFLVHGYASLFRYAAAVLRMSDAQAYLRIQAARLGRRYPVVLEMLAQGALNLSTIKLLDPLLTVDNHEGLLERARNKTKREVELLVAEVAPLPDVPTKTRKLPVRAAGRATPHGTQAGTDARQHVLVRRSSVEAEAKDVAARQASLDVATALPGAEEAAAVQSASVRAASAAAPAEVGQRDRTAFALEAPRASCTPLRPGRFKLELTASQPLHDKLMQLQHLLRHQVPGGDLAVIVERAVDVLLEKTLKQRFAQVSKPRTSAVKSSAVVAAVGGSERDDVQRARASKGFERGAPGAQRLGTDAKLMSPSQARSGTRSRYIPRAVLREVFARDGGQCTFVGLDGQRCSERGRLEVHHIRAFARGGEATARNLALACRSHNAFYAEQDFGAAHMVMKRAASSEHRDLGVLFGG